MVVAYDSFTFPAVMWEGMVVIAYSTMVSKGYVGSFSNTTIFIL